MPRPISRVVLYALALALLPGVATAGDDLSDFSNNLAQDLGPLLTLFGEPVTRQYLSESTTFLDYFIFALCPLGIITAVTAAVRVCGHSSLRAFIGRSQEGNGIVEAELCTSTSRDVCELFNNGGITRVLGQPNVLELVCAFPSNKSPVKAAGPGYQRVSLFQDYLARTDESVSEWKKLPGFLVVSGESRRGPSNIFAPKPNLSLNVGIKRQPSWIFVLMALTGLVLQVGIVVLADFGAWRLGWNINSSSSPSSTNYAPRMFIAGTLLLCVGMCSCAALVGQATQEVTYKRRRTSSEQYSMLLWLQPGPQVVGDQSFDPFAHMEDPSNPLDYWISSKKRKTGRAFELFTLVAATFTIISYVLQFIGLRGMKAWVSIAQLATTLVMGFLRGLLRMQKFGEGDNALARMPDLVSGHELDWMAFEIAHKASPVLQSPSTLERCERFLSLVNSSLGKLHGETNGSSKLDMLSPPASDNSPCWHITGQNGAARAHAVERTDSSSSSGDVTHTTTENNIAWVTDSWESESVPNDCRRLLATRAQLARVTGHFTFENLPETEHQKWKDSLVRVRAKAKLLAAAVGNAGNVLLQSWDRSKGKLPASISLVLKTFNSPGHLASCGQEIHIDMKLVANALWKVDSAQIEALLGLWMWSLLNDERLTYADEAGNVLSSAGSRVESMQIVSASLDDESQAHQTYAQDDMNLWLGSTGPMVSQYVLAVDNRQTCKPGDLWVSSHGERGVWHRLNKSRLDSHATLRFFGWNVVHQSRDCGRSTESDERLKIQAVSRTGSLLDVCASEVFSALICSLGSLEGLHLTTVESTLVEHDGDIQLENRAITNLTRAFVESGLGTRSDALVSVVPALRNHVHPSSNELLYGLMSNVDAYRRKGEWQRAEVLTRWACRETSPSCGTSMSSDVFEAQGQQYVSPLAYVLVKTGELYRWAFADGKTKEQNLFGFAGVQWMSQFLGKALHDENSTEKENTMPSGFSGATEGEDDIIRRYMSVAERVARADAQAEPLQAATAIAPLVQALNDRNRADALYHLCLVKAGAFGAKPLQPAFPLAMRNGWSAIAEAILELKGSVDSRDEEGRTAVSHCAEHGLDWALDRLIQLGAFLDQADGQGRTPLHWAAQAGNVSTVKTLMNSGQVDGDRKDAQDITPFWDSLHRDRISVAEELLAAGVAVESRQKDEHTPLTWAAQEGQLEMMKTLLKQGASVEAKGPRERNAVHWAAAMGQTSCLQLLLEWGGDFRGHDKHYESPLDLAAQGGHEGCLDALIRHGADVNGVNTSNRPTLERAAGCGRIRIVRKLLEYGADLNRRSTNGWCALLEAAVAQRDEMLGVLLDHGADINYTDNRNRSCLHWVMDRAQGAGTTVKTLLKRGIDVNIADSSGETGLHLAASHGYRDTVAMLLQHDGIQLDMQEKYRGNTPLIVAAKRGHVDVVRMLLQHGAAINLANKHNQTALMHAAELTDGNEYIIPKLLLDNGADINVVTDTGRTALTYAYQHYRDYLAQIFIEKGAKGMQQRVGADETKQASK